MATVNGLTGYLLLALKLLALGAGVFTLIHAARQRPDAFTAVEKLTKPIWLIILAVAVLLLVIDNVVGIGGIIGVIAISVYLVDVRPRLDEIQRGGSW